MRRTGVELTHAAVIDGGIVDPALRLLQLAFQVDICLCGPAVRHCFVSLGLQVLQSGSDLFGQSSGLRGITFTPLVFKKKKEALSHHWGSLLILNNPGRHDGAPFFTYCLLRSDSLAVMAAISPSERKMSSLSFGSSHMSAIFLASVSRALTFSSPSGPPLGSANQFYGFTQNTVKYRNLVNPCLAKVNGPPVQHQSFWRWPVWN